MQKSEQQTNPYNHLAPPAMDVLWQAITDQFGTEAYEQLKAVYDLAHRRHQRALTLVRFQRDVAILPQRKGHGWDPDKIDQQVAYRQRALDNPEAFINGELDDPPIGGKFRRV